MNLLRHWSDDDTRRIARELARSGLPLYISADEVRDVLEAAGAVPAGQLEGAVEAERAEIVTLLQEIADAEPRMSEARIAILSAAKRIHQRGQ